MTTNSISNIAKEIKANMGGNAMDICSGDCAVFAKRLIAKVGSGEIIYTSDFGLMDEIEDCGIEISLSKYRGKDNGYSHCFAKIDGKFYDAFNCAGKKYESQMTFRKFKLDDYGFLIS